jgi:hypothetical protein
MTAKIRLDWLARNHERLFYQANATVKYLTPPVLDRIGIMGSSLVWYNSVFIPKHTVYSAAYENWFNVAERTRTKIAVLNTSEGEFIVVYRDLYMGYLKRNPLVTDADLVEMGLPKHSTGGRTPSTPPTTMVEVMRLDTSFPATVIIYYRDQFEKGTAKPKYVRGAEIAYEILTTPPTDWTQLKNSVFCTKTPARLVFPGGNRGKILYFALRWENNVGEKGPWSVIYNAYIP